MYADKNRQQMMDIWCKMIDRCTKPTHISYPSYGGRGIKVCDKWLSSFEEFMADVGNRPSKNHSIDRIDNDGDYMPSNVKWSTSKEQALNRSTTQLVTIDGVVDSLAGWSKRKGISPQTLHHRIRKLNLPIEVALSFPASRKTCKSKTQQIIK
jgi:hypothetical protein